MTDTPNPTELVLQVEETLKKVRAAIGRVPLVLLEENPMKQRTAAMSAALAAVEQEVSFLKKDLEEGLDEDTVADSANELNVKYEELNDEFGEFIACFENEIAYLKENKK